MEYVKSMFTTFSFTNKHVDTKPGWDWFFEERTDIVWIAVVVLAIALLMIFFRRRSNEMKWLQTGFEIIQYMETNDMITEIPTEEQFKSFKMNGTGKDAGVIALAILEKIELENKAYEEQYEKMRVMKKGKQAIPELRTRKVAAIIPKSAAAKNALDLYRSRLSTENQTQNELSEELASLHPSAVVLEDPNPVSEFHQVQRPQTRCPQTRCPQTESEVHPIHRPETELELKSLQRPSNDTGFYTLQRPQSASIPISRGSGLDWPPVSLQQTLFRRNSNRPPSGRFGFDSDQTIDLDLFDD